MMVLVDAQLAAFDAIDRVAPGALDGRTSATNTDAVTPCVADGRARVAGVFISDSSTTFHNSFDVSFDACADDIAIVDGQLRVSSKEETNGLWASELLGTVVVQEGSFGQEYSDSATCELDVHGVVQSVPQGDLFTTEGKLCGYDAASLFPPNTARL